MTSSKTKTDTASAAEAEAEAACAFQFPDSQGKNYRTTEFVFHSRVAELVGDQIGRVFYNNVGDDGDTGSGDGGVDNIDDDWLIDASQLQNMVLMNILQEGQGEGDGDKSSSSNTLYSRYPIYGSAIAFEPGVWTDNNSIAEGVTYPAASQACLEDESHCTTDAASSWNDLRLTTLKQNSDGQTMYSPFAFRGPPNESVYKNCSRDQPEFCPSLDLAHAYDYVNVTMDGNEWYTAPRCLYLRDGIRTGYWTSPYFDANAGEINMVTYSQPIIAHSSGKFLGVATIDITVDALCYGDQCGTAVDYNYLSVEIRSVGFVFVAVAMVCALGCGVWTQVYSKDRVVIASQPFFLRLICCGCLIMACSIIPLSIDDGIVDADGCSIACMAFPWLLSIGFTATFSALFSKIWRLNKVFRNARNMRRVTVKVHDALWPFAILMTANCAIMVAWTRVDPLIWYRTEPDDAYQSRGYCRAEGQSHITFRILIVLVNAAALVLANIQAFRARNITTEFSESLYVMMTMVSLLQALLIGAPLLVIVNENTVAKYFISAGFIFVVTMATLGLMFAPKMYLVRHNARGSGGGRESRVTITGHAAPANNNAANHQSIPTNGNNANTIRGNKEEAPEVVIVTSSPRRGDVECPGTHSVMTGKF